VPSTPFIAPTECAVLMNAVLQEHLQNVSTQVCHLQGEQNASFPKKKCLWKAAIYEVLRSAEVSLLTLLKYRRYSTAVLGDSVCVLLSLVVCLCLVGFVLMCTY